VALIHDQCQSMLHQVEDLLGVAALEADGVGLKRGPFDVRQLVSRIVEGCEPRTRGRPVDLSVQAELAQPFRVGDSMRIRQVIRNLLDNALKFTDHGAVRVRVYAGNGELLCVEVADSGPGMAAHDVARMFEPFVQGDDATTRRHGGVGLGLAIVQRLVRAMEGELHVDSALGRGTTITLRLPLPFAEASVSEPPRALDGGSYPAHVLVVDDSAPARELLSAMLRRHGASATCAATGEEAKRMLAAGNFDLVLLDYQMPGADGAETGIALRRMLDARTEGRTVPIYLLTANVFARDALKKAGHAFAGILDKPLGQADLLRLLRGLGPPAGRGPEAEPPLLDAAVVADLRSTVARDGRSMLERFVPRVLGELQAELTPLMGEAAQPADHAHTLHALAGNALSIGARALGALLRTAVARARAGDAAGTRAALARAPQLLADTRAALDAR
jgi:CheY-like chemotaxis protein